jgi:hypothetical protein
MTERKENEIAGSRELESLPNEKKKKKKNPFTAS